MTHRRGAAGRPSLRAADRDPAPSGRERLAPVFDAHAELLGRGGTSRSRPIAPREPEAWSRELLTMQSAILAAGGDLDRIMEAVVAGALRVIPHADGAVVEMRSDDRLVYRAASGSSAGQVGTSVPVGGSLSGRCLASGEPQICYDAEVDDRVDREACRRVGLRSMIMVPLPCGGRHVGVLKLHAAVPAAFDSRDLLTTQLLAGPIAMGLANVAYADVELARESADRRFVATFEQAAVGIAHVAPDGRFLRVNDRFSAIAGHDRAALVAGGFQPITHPDDIAIDLAYFDELLAGGRDSYSMEKRYIRRGGDIVWINLTCSLVRTDAGAPDFIVAVIEDISRRKTAEAAAAHDPLTGLLNRRGFLARLDEALARRRDAGLPFAVAYLDLNGFKAINDRYGHAEGDRCLARIAEGLRADLPAGATVARIGGDEFVVALPALGDPWSLAVLESLRGIVAAAADDEPWTLSAAVGAVLVAADSIADAAAVIAAADELMYRAKQDGRTRALIETLG